MRSHSLLLLVSSVALAGCRLVAGVDDKAWVADPGTTSATSTSGASGGGGGASTTGAGGGGASTSTTGGGAGGATGTSTVGSGGAGGGAAPCFAQCNGACTDTLTDPLHCGSCDVACPQGVSCDEGVCGRSLPRDAGSGSFCAMKANGTLYCWGANDQAQAGLGGASGPIASPIPANALAAPVRYAGGTGGTTCALLQSGGVSCFGANEHGEIGNAETGGPDMCGYPDGCVGTPFSSIASGIAEVAGAGNWQGGSHFCARKQSGQVLCWGTFGDGGLWANSAVPKAIAGMDDAVQIAVSANASCAIRADGTVWCWGDNGRGELAQGNLNPHIGPVKVPGLSGVTTIGAGTWHFCARAPDGLYCWGNNRAAQLGTGSTDENGTSPAPVVATPGLDDVVQIAGSLESTCAVTAKGDVFCWGRSDTGMIGDGSYEGDPCPIDQSPCALTPRKASLSGVVEIALGYDSALARLGDGEIVAWGVNNLGQLGNGSFGGSSATPTPIQNFP